MMFYLVAVILIIVGLWAARRGLFAAQDPEGRGGSYMLQGVVGACVACVALCWLLWMGLDDIIHLVQMASH